MLALKNKRVFIFFCEVLSLPDLLGATNPVPGHDRTNVNRNMPIPPSNEHVQNVPNTQQVTRPDGRGGQQEDSAQSENGIRYDSNFQVFLKRLRETPDAAESLRRIFAGEGFRVSSGISEGSATELSELFSFLQADEAELLKFLMGQIKSGGQFGGALFALLRNAYARADSEMVQDSILRFVRAYLDYFSADRIEGSILRNLNRMADGMPASWAERLQGMIEQLKTLMSSGNKQDSLLFIQRDILSFMSQYIERSHDMGLPRQMLSMLTLDLARYANSDENTLLEAFHQVKGFGTLRQQLANIDDEALLELLHRSRPNVNTQVSRFTQGLVENAYQALRGNGSMETQNAFQELVRAILINESVYMPLNHYLIPIEMNDRMLFSELWVDPDAENDSSGSQGKQQGKAMRFLFKMDVQGIGMIDLILSSRGDEVDLKLSCPDRLLPFTKMIEQDMGEILKRNELKPTQVSVRKMSRPTTLTEVFPKIFERRDSLNVTV